MTEEEVNAHLALADARLRVANGEYVTPEEYRGIIIGLQAGRESRARAQSEASRAKAKARRAAARPKIDIDSLFASLKEEPEG